MHPAHEQHPQLAHSIPVPGVRTQRSRSSNGDFGPAGYHPAAVDAFVESVAARIDELQVEHLRTLAELDQLRTRTVEGTPVHSVLRVRPGAEFVQQCHGAAYVIRTEIDTAERRAARVVSDAETCATNILDAAKRDAACALAAARAQSAKKLAEAQSSAERILQRAHERATELSAVSALSRLDTPPESPLALVHSPAASALASPKDAATPSSVVTAVTKSASLVAPDPDHDPQVKQERTFEALWNASSDQTDANIERYFRPSPFRIAK